MKDELIARAQLFASIEPGLTFWSREIFEKGPVEVLKHCLEGKYEYDVKKIIETDGINTAATFIEQGDIDVVLSEWYLSASYGVDLIRWLRRTDSDIRFTPFIMMTSQTRLESVTTARNAGITEFVAKPFSAKSLVARIREVVERLRPFVAIGQYFGPDRRRRADGRAAVCRYRQWRWHLDPAAGTTFRPHDPAAPEFVR